MPHIDKGTRERIAKFLPKALETALSSYRNFSRAKPESGAEHFKKHHDACKVALAHIELLLKLAGRLHLPDSEITDEITQQQLMEIIESGKGTVSSFESEEQQEDL